MNNKNFTLRLMVFTFMLHLLVGCTELLSSTSLLGSGLTNSGLVDEGDTSLVNDTGTEESLINPLDDSESGLMETGPMPIPVTMTKADGLDWTRFDVQSEIYNDGELVMIRSAFASGDLCEVGFECRVTITGLSGAVIDPVYFPYIHFYVSEDNNLTQAVNADGSFASVELFVNMIEEEEGDDLSQEIAAQATTLSDPEDENALGSLPVYFVVTSSGRVRVTMTNTDEDLITGLLYVDDVGNTYFASTQSAGVFDLWRQAYVGEVPLLVLDDYSTVINSISAIDSTVYIHFIDGTLQQIEIDELSSRIWPGLFPALSSAMADNATATVGEPITIATMASGSALTLHPISKGFITVFDPDRWQGGASEKPDFLIGFLDFEGRYKTLVPLEAPLQAQIWPIKIDASIDFNGNIYMISEFETQNGSRLEFSALPITEEGYKNFKDRKVIKHAMSFSRILKMDALNGRLIFSASKINGDIVLASWTSGTGLKVLWDEASQIGLSSHLRLKPGVLLAEGNNGEEFLLSCAVVTEDGDNALSEEALEAAQKRRGAQIVAHRIGIDDVNVMRPLVTGVDYDSCPDGMIVAENRLYFFDKGSESQDIKPQLSAIALNSVEMFKGFFD